MYIGFDEPKSLGRYETGAKTAMPVFNHFVKNKLGPYDLLTEGRVPHLAAEHLLVTPLEHSTPSIAVAPEADN